MDILTLLVVLVLVGLLLWVLTTYVPMPEPYRKAVIVIIVVLVIVWFVRQLGLSLPRV